jgi:ABC-type multidrug transport system fused ATPase/permease subunit
MNKRAKWQQSIVIGKRILKETDAFKSTFYLLILLSLVLGGISMLRPYLIQISVDNYIRKLDWHGLVWITVIQLLVLLSESGLRFLFLYRMNWLGMHIMMRIRNNVFGTFFELLKSNELKYILLNTKLAKDKDGKIEENKIK